jgi:hypothetical protein
MCGAAYWILFYLRVCRASALRVSSFVFASLCICLSSLHLLYNGLREVSPFHCTAEGCGLCHH